MCRGTRRETWITPFIKQCFAVSSVILNMISHGMTSGYNASLFSELRKTREIPLDVDSESWLASLIGATFLVGSIVNSIVMEVIGRKPAILLSSVLTICGWISFSLASSFPALLIGKIFQGISVGIGGSLGSILIGEYTSPRYRGPFIAAVPTPLLVGILISHTFGMSYGWHDLSWVLLFFSLPGLVVAVFSPESPSFLVTKGRYDECRKVFRWLRGTDEDNELETMIKTDKILKKTKRAYTGITPQLIRIKLTYVVAAFKKREFRIPVIIMTHLNAILEFCGSIMSDVYALDVHTAFYGTDVYMFTVITTLDVLRLVATVSGIYITSRVKRRSMMLIFVSLNVIVNLSIAGYIYARQRGVLPFDHLAIGLFLHHFLYFIIGAGPMPLSGIITGEIFPLADRGLCSIISRITCSIYLFGDIKSAPYLFTIVGVEGVFGLYGLILAYSLVVTLIYLPETKDRTLQEVEDGFRGYAIGEREEALELKCNELKDDA